MAWSKKNILLDWHGIESLTLVGCSAIPLLSIHYVAVVEG
jgi:hypothetical protein